MKSLLVLVIVFTTYSSQYDLPKILRRDKRETAGALDIVTDDAHPIHTDIRTGDMVIPPSDVVFAPKSLRKSFPSGTLELVRGSSRVVTLVALICAAAVEVYPLVYNLYQAMYEYFGV